MKRTIGLALTCLIIVACGAKYTVIPQDLEKLGSIKPAMEKLSNEERDLVTGYITRHTLGAQMQSMFGGDAEAGIPKGMTFEKAIHEQRRFLADRKTEDQQESKLKAAHQATNDAVLACLQTHVTLNNSHFEGGDGSWFKVDVTNNLPWAIRGYHIAYAIKGDGREVPIKEDDSSGEVSGGIEPGEKKTITVWSGVNIRSYKTITINASLINVFDPENRRLIDNSITYVGRSPELSKHICGSEAQLRPEALP